MNDTIALNTIQSIYPNKIIVGIDCSNMFYEGGMVHCVTQQQPINLEQSCMSSQSFSNKKIITTLDVLGKETTNNKGFQLEIYDDGSVEKKYVIE